jgi:hypothetical protein
MGLVLCSCKRGNELSGSNKLWRIVEYLSNWRLLENDLAHGVGWSEGICVNTQIEIQP